MEFNLDLSWVEDEQLHLPCFITKFETDQSCT